jgi:thiol-disulfide isomerase/thioredoxin
MSHRTKKRTARLTALALLIVTVAVFGAPQRREQPPEAKEFTAAIRIQDPRARIRELERIIAAYPESQYRISMEMAIVNARIEMSTEIGAVRELQQSFLEDAEGLSRLSMLARNAAQILDHPNLAGFDKAKTLEILFDYVGEGRKLASDPAFVEKIPEARKRYLSNIVPNLILTEARALVYAGEYARAGEALEAYERAQGAKNSSFHYLRGEVLAGSGKRAEAVDAYLEAAADIPRGFTSDAADKAKDLHLDLGGTEAALEAKLEKRLRELPYHPEVFVPSRTWKGKTVLLELFTGSECPPCVGADLGFDGILEAYDPKYAAVLEYHLPIPGPDPMMNPASGERQTLYGVTSAPTVVIDGESRQSYIGGGSRAMAEEKFNFYASEIMTRVYEEPELTVKASATLAGDSVRVEFSASEIPSGSDIHVALVQGEERYRGSNGLLFHKMVVRDIRTAAPGAGQVIFDLAGSEKAADSYLTDFENPHARFPDFRFPERKFKIDRTRLLAVVFVQDQSSKKVWNAAVTGVQKR